MTSLADIRTVQVIGNLSGGGSERLAINLAEALALAGVSRSIVVTVSAHASSVRLPKCVSTVAVGGRVGVLRPATALVRLSRFLATEQPNLVHVHGKRTLFLTVLASMLVRRQGILAFTWHTSGSSPLDTPAWRRGLLLWAFRRCDLLFAASSSLAEHLNAVAPSRKTSWKVFRNGVDVPVRSRPYACRGRILWLGRLVPTKGLHSLLRVAARLRRAGHDFSITVAGDAPSFAESFKEDTLNLVSSLGLQAHVSFVGWVDDPAPLIDAADIGVQTSLAEGLSMAVLEYMAAGLAVVATNVGDTGEAIVNRESGLLIPPDDDDQLFHALDEILSNPSLAAKLGASAHARARERFCIGTMAAQVLGSCCHLLAIPGRPGDPSLAQAGESQ